MQPNPKFDQAAAQLRDTLPPLWYGLYQGCIDAGFSHAQAFCLVQTYVLGMHSSCIKPNDGPSLPPETP